MSKPRIEEIETLRGFAFLAVVMQHAIAHYYPVPEARLEDGVLLGLILLLSKFAVPLFVFITGLVLFYNYEGDIRYSIFIRKRLKDIVLPYLPWAVLYAVGFQQLNLLEAGSLSKLGAMIATGKASYHLWYIVMIFQLYLLFPLLQKAVKRLKPTSANKTALAILLLGILYLLLMGLKGTIYRTAAQLDIPFLTGFFTTYLDRNALMYFFYFALGAAAGLHLESWHKWLVRYRYYIMGLFAVLLSGMLYITVSSFKLVPSLGIRYDGLVLLRPDMAVYLIVSVLAVYVFSMIFVKTSPASLRRTIALCGTYSYVAYLAHACVLRFTEIIADVLFPGGSVTVRTITAFILCAAGSILLAFLIRQIVVRFKSSRGRVRHQTKPFSA
ncbi:acyltransferase [Paenibacillus sp. sptzw28]|uniref:acyltransferase n=1 Tax=Paenibacillus sp. sptzw28 TaxID=715179 RepID=UPI001C6E8001|nr:acyltransferase [Paenibacillus sp. sptzw28]QYR21945.1 acyltransferase [Paenibacillus sp. sptzw28]